MLQATDILSVWFDRLPSESGTGKSRKVWFSQDAAFDHLIQTRWRSPYHQAAAGELDQWQETAEGALALILLLDQAPRHLFRGDPRAFATDAKAVSVAEGSIAQGFDQQVSIVQRWFMYLPFEHSESLEHQQRSVELFRPLQADPDTQRAYLYAVKHHDVIQRFGRFPHRNQILGRESTSEELEFLKQPGSSFSSAHFRNHPSSGAST